MSRTTSRSSSRPPTSQDDIQEEQEGEQYVDKIKEIASYSIKKKLDVNDVLEKIRSVLNLENTHTDLLNSTILDFWFNNLEFARENRMSEEQAGAILEMGENLFNSIRENQGNIDQAIQNLKDYLNKFTQKRTIEREVENPDKRKKKKSELETETVILPPIFDRDDAKKVTQYFRDTVFQHAKLISLVGNVDRDVNTRNIKVFVNTPAPPTALVAGKSKLTIEKEQEQEQENGSNKQSSRPSSKNKSKKK
eukprot:gb/GECH01006914.1/.p1 GENE.gb/GECH01006914.1/~~gb/GECH01006914.1/.p1  ORF type:complete len:250 (+),score=75.22 gb/GECH01006914.1/:1-750(+)